MPTPLATIQDRLPAVLERAEARSRRSKRSSARIPDSLDRSDRFFTNVERIFRESELPALSADSRKFFATTGTQIEQMTAEMNRLIGDGGTLVKFIDEMSTVIEAADLPATTQTARNAFGETSLAADDLDARCRPFATPSTTAPAGEAARRAARGRGVRSAASREESAVTRSLRPRARLLVTIACAMAAACRLQRPETRLSA